MKRNARALSAFTFIAAMSALSAILFASCTPTILEDDSYTTGASDTPSVLVIEKCYIPGYYSIDGTKVVFEEGSYTFTTTYDDTISHQATIEFTPDDPAKKIGFSVHEGNLSQNNATIKKNPITVLIRQSTITVRASIID